MCQLATNLHKLLYNGINFLLEQWGADADAGDSVMVGDYVFDLEAGQAANVATVHINALGYHPWPDITDLSINHLHQLMEN